MVHSHDAVDDFPLLYVVDACPLSTHPALARVQVRVLVTSRPEGVQVSTYAKTFVVMNLCELTNEQQRRVINVQMQGSEFFDHLLSLGEARKSLDEAFNKLKEVVRGMSKCG